MENIESLSKRQLLELLSQQQSELALRDQQLAASQEEIVTSEEKLVASEKEVARGKDMIRQLEEKHRQLEKEYLQLLRDRFGRKSERYIADPSQLRIDFGDTDDAADAADGHTEAVEEAGLSVKAHVRRKRKETDALLTGSSPTL